MKCVLNRSCLEQIVSCETQTSIVKCVLTDRVLNRMRQGLPFLCVSSGSCTSCSGRSGSSLRKVHVHLCSGGWSCDGSVNTHDQETGSGVALPRESAFRVLVHWTSAALHKPNILVSLRRHIKTKRHRADVSCQNINSDKACPTVDLCDGCAEKLWIRWSVIAHACKNCVRVLCLTR